MTMIMSTVNNDSDSKTMEKPRETTIVPFCNLYACMLLKTAHPLRSKQFQLMPTKTIHDFLKLQ